LVYLAYVETVELPGLFWEGCFFFAKWKRLTDRLALLRKCAIFMIEKPELPDAFFARALIGNFEQIICELLSYS
jgi:hypothetical protein